MILPPTKPPLWIDQPASLQRMVDDLLGCKVLSVDTESNSLFAYQEQVCLIQFSTGERDYLVDPLNLGDLTPLAALFAAPEIEKVFHAAEYDIICLKRDFGFAFDNLFDTMIAGRTLGCEAVGLSALLEAAFGVRLDKRYQRANWSQRPLPSHLQAYARLDTYYLIPLRHSLEADLKQAGRWELAQEDFVRLGAIRVPANNGSVKQCWRTVGGNDLDPQQTALLQQLCEYRQQQAQHANLPPFKVLGNDLLVKIAQTMPQDVTQLKQIEGMNKRLLQRHGRELLKIVQQAPALAPLHRSRHARPSDAYLQRLEALRNWRKKVGEELGAPSDVVLPKDVLETIAGGNPRSPAELGEMMRDLPWRFQRFGEQIVGVLKKVEAG